MNRALLALLLAATVAVSAQAPKSAPPATKPAPAAKPAPAPAAAILANKESKTYHKADCKAAAKIKDANKASFVSAAEAEKAGYKACKVCKP